MNEQIIIFFDTLGRTIIGTVKSEDASVLQVVNPAVLHAGLSNDNKIQVNLIPAFFREFLSDWNKPIVFEYQKSSITREVNGATLDNKLIAQYQNMWSTRPAREEVQKVRELAPTINNAKPVEKLNLFDSVSDSK